MGFEELQKEVDTWAQQFDPPYWPPLEQCARLTEETGEVARELNHLHGTKKKKSSEEVKELGDELTDVVFTVCCIANAHDINLQGFWKQSMEKKHYGRDNSRFTKRV